jgi:hypothetical protein
MRGNRDTYATTVPIGSRFKVSMFASNRPIESSRHRPSLSSITLKDPVRASARPLDDDLAKIYAAHAPPATAKQLLRHNGFL